MAKQGVKVRYYRFKNKLKDRTAGIGTGANAADAIDPEAMARAEEALGQMSEDYPDWVSAIIDKLAEQYRRAVDTPHERRGYFEQIRRIAHDMKGQGGTFGYPLITDFAASLYDFTGPNVGMTDNHVEIIKAHVDSMRVVINERIEGDGGENGQMLKQGLHQAIEKYTKLK